MGGTNARVRTHARAHTHGPTWQLHAGPDTESAGPGRLGRRTSRSRSGRGGHLRRRRGCTMARLCALALALARVALVCVGRSRAVGGAAGSCAAARPTRTCAACLPPAVPYTLHHQLLSRQNGDAMAWERSPRRGRTPRDRTMDFHCHGMENITPAENITPTRTRMRTPRGRTTSPPRDWATKDRCGW